jgi:nitrite reductase/ring-hydroxylating ferredoxin subunit
MRLVEVAPLEAVRTGFVTLYKPEGRLVVVSRVGDEIRAWDGMCTHAKFRLATSRLFGGCEIECPVHAARFHGLTGEVTKGPATVPLIAMEAVVEDGILKLRVDWPEQETQ